MPKVIAKVRICDIHRRSSALIWVRPHDRQLGARIRFAVPNLQVGRCQDALRGTRHGRGGNQLEWLLLAGAILSEVTATISLKLSEGFSKLVPSVIVVVGYVCAFILLSQVLKRGMSIGVAYGIWAAVGVALVALVGALFLGDSLTLVQVGGLVLVGGGVLALEFGASH